MFLNVIVMSDGQLPAFDILVQIQMKNCILQRGQNTA